jgi:uncharacterized protein
MDPLYVPLKIRTFSGEYVNVFEPDLETLKIVDIAHALSMNPRYGGHSPVFISVAEHSVWLHDYMQFQGYSDDECYSGLMHDSSEAYLVDIPKPIKLELPDYNRVEDNLMKALAKKFEFTYPLSPTVKTIDKVALEWEWKYIVTTKKKRAKTMNQKEAKKAFLKRYNLYKQKSGD